MRYKFAILLIVAVLASCGSDDTSGPGEPPDSTAQPVPTSVPMTETPDVAVPSDLLGRTWVLDSQITIAGPQPIPDSVQADLTVYEDGSVSLHTGCNQGGGMITEIEGDRITLRSLSTTLVLCADPDQNKVEAGMLAVLAEPSNWYVEGDTLTITPLTVSDSGLRLHAGASAPGEPLATVRTTVAV